MAIYKPDYTLIDAEEVVEKLGDSKKDQLIKYYINDKESRIVQLKNIIKKYENFFELMNELLPNNNGTFKLR
jgi:hypothetical protein